MTVADLIEELQRRPPLERVYFYVSGVGLSENVYEEYAGWHDVDRVRGDNVNGCVTTLISDGD